MAEGGDVPAAKAPYAAIVFGWWGSRPRHLRRYEELHRGLGAAPVVAIGCSMAEMWVPSRGRRAVEAVEAALEGKRPLVAHIFSNGGMSLYLRFFGERPEAVRRLAATIFDSAPGDLSAGTFVDAFAATLPPVFGLSAKLLPLAAAGALVLSPRGKPAAIRLLGAALLFWLAQRRFNSKYFELCASDPFRGPSLYLYSSADKLVSAGVVERMIAERRLRVGRGRVRGRRWERSPHVAHYLRHPEEYRQEVQGLVEEALCERTQEALCEDTQQPEQLPLMSG